MSLAVSVLAFLRLVKDATKSKGTHKMQLIKDARDIHQEMDLEELKQLGSEAARLTEEERSILWAVGLREPARSIMLEGAE
jgi:hypothetical protein